MSLTSDQNTLLDNLIETAIKIEHGTGMPFTKFTGIIGELSICKDQNFTWEPNEGFDAIEKESRGKIQIKTRRLTTGEEMNALPLPNPSVPKATIIPPIPPPTAGY